MSDFALWLEENGWYHWIDDKYLSEVHTGFKPISHLLVDYLNEIKQ